MSTSPEDRSGRFLAAKLRDALSSLVRIRILMVLERHSGTLASLRDEAIPELSLEEVKYHIGVLVEAGCLEVERPSTGNSRSGEVYRADPEVFLEPMYLGRAVAFEEQESLALNWIEVSVDPVGREQVFDIIRSTRLQLLMVEEQSRSRCAVTADELRPLIVGAVGFDATRQEKGG